MLKVSNKTVYLFSNLAKVLAPPPDLTVSEWADENRMLSREASSEPGRWRTSRAPYQKEIMDSVNDPTIENIVVMTSSQVGKTEIILNIIGYYIDYDPAPIMLIQPTLEMAEAFSKDRIAPMIRDTPVLNKKVAGVKSRKSKNTLLHKSFIGGHLTLVGANSAASLASRPIRVLLADEVDRFPASAGTEGDPLSLAEKRTTTFWNKKKVYVSTPVDKGTSRIEAAYLNSTQEEWNYPCPTCGEYQPLTWAQIRFEDVTHECLHCRGKHNEFEWKAGQGKWVAKEPLTDTRGFHLNELSSPWVRWGTIIDNFIKAKKAGPDLLKTWVNTSLGESWEIQGDKVEADELINRCEEYEAQLPEGVILLTAGVDVQDDRFEVEVVGWGVGKESWGIDYKVIYGDPDQKAVWNQLDDYLQRKWTFKDGTKVGVICTCVDSGGHFTTEVYKFCRPREYRRVYAIKGQGGAGLPIVKKHSKNNRVKAALFPLGVDTLKEVLLLRLKITEAGAGYCHFPSDVFKGYDRSYFNGLTSEKRVLSYKKGRPFFEWIKKSGTRNEPLDCRNYATAAMEIVNPNFERLAKLPKQDLYKQTVPKGKKRRRRIVSKGVSV